MCYVRVLCVYDRFLQFILSGETVGRWAGSNHPEYQIEQTPSNTVSTG